MATVSKLRKALPLLLFLMFSGLTVVQAQTSSLLKVESIQAGFSRLVHLRIADQGPGIPKLEAERIFERFYRIKDEQGHRQKGHGLGLHLARELMRTMDGDLYLDSNYQEGAAFIIEFVADV